MMTDPTDGVAGQDPYGVAGPELDGAVVRELMVELAQVEYAIRHTAPDGLAPPAEAAALVVRERAIVAELRRRRVPASERAASTPGRGSLTSAMQAL